MLEHAISIGTKRPVEWRQADVVDLPFPDASFDAAICQFGVMFFPDKVKAFSEVHRVLRPGGGLFSTPGIESKRTNLSIYGDDGPGLDVP